jgi:hypothetical protein
MWKKRTTISYDVKRLADAVERMAAVAEKMVAVAEKLQPSKATQLLTMFAMAATASGVFNAIDLVIRWIKEG